MSNFRGEQRYLAKNKKEGQIWIDRRYKQKGVWHYTLYAPKRKIKMEIVLVKNADCPHIRRRKISTSSGQQIMVHPL